MVTAKKDVIAEALSRGQTFLRNHAGKLHTITDTGITVFEIFSQFLILDATGSKKLVDLSVEKKRGKQGFNFFKCGAGQLTTKTYPDDLDTTAIALLTMPTLRNPDTTRMILDEMLQCRDEHGIIEVYFDRNRRRTGEPCVCVNVLRLFYKHGRGSELNQTLDYVYSVLYDRSYLKQQYYTVPECFLYFLSLLMAEQSAINTRFSALFKQRLREHFGGGVIASSSNPLALAMRIICCRNVDVSADPEDISNLLAAQATDGAVGAWPNGAAYRIRHNGVLLTNDGLTTALAVKALQTLLI